MFLGQYEHNIDDKGRLTIPARYRELLDPGAHITRGFDRNLIVLTSTSWNSLCGQIKNLNNMDLKARDLKRKILANAHPVEVDKIGRILIPPFLRSFACLDGPAVLIGQDTYFEVWSKPLWDVENARLDNVEADPELQNALNISLVF